MSRPSVGDGVPGSSTTALADQTPDAADDAIRFPSGVECIAIIARRHGLHVSAEQITLDNHLSGAELSPEEIANCAARVGLRARRVRLTWRGLSHLRKALPVVVTLTSGASMVLEGLEGDDEAVSVILQDPKAGEDAKLVVDRQRFEEAWTREVVLLRRIYDLADEEQPFTLGMIAGLILRERRIVRDLAICAMALSLFALAPIIFWRLLSDKVIYYGSLNTFAVLCFAMGVVIVFETIFAYLRSYLVLFATARVDVRLSEYLMDNVLKLPIDYFERTQVGLIGRDMNEIWKVRTFLTGQLFGTVLDSLTLFVFLPVMFFFSPLLTLVVLVLCVLIVGWLVMMLPHYRKRTGAVMRAEGERGAFLFQTLQGIRTVKSLSLEDRQRRQWDVHVARIAKLKLEEGFLAAVVHAGVRPLERLAVNGAYALGVYFAITTRDPVYIGALFAFLMLTQRVSGPLLQMAQLINQYDEARSAVTVVGRLVNQPKEEGNGDRGVHSPLSGHVEFVKVRFKYLGATSPALDNLSFEIPIGHTFGIVGRSGSGKTTVTRLLQRLHSDYEGLIKVDGIDVREYNVSHLRRSLGVVLQENFLFSGTIRENITAAKPHATFDDVVRAARLAGAEEFIDRLPRGYETHIYEGSPNLSGGQRQRLAIARALILDPKILILDEATSALDPDSEAIVNENIRRIASGRTVIVISHRLSSLVNSDAILVLERGKVEAIGKHEELLETCDIYSGLWHQQNRHLSQSKGPVVDLRGGARA
jgi:ATP-binding cassette, subfamily B, bacterial HlyB/CyaB